MYFVGLDLGQKQDPAAVAVVEKVLYPKAGTVLRYVERAPLDTPYGRIVEWVRHLVSHREITGRCELAVDATGVGNPVVEMLRRAGLGCPIHAVTITGGDKPTQAGQAWGVPKSDLMAGLQLALEEGNLTIAKDIREREALVRELLDVQMRPGQKGRTRIGADGNGQHDDLVIALALAIWRAERGVRRAVRPFRGPRDYDPVLKWHCRIPE